MVSQINVGLHFTVGGCLLMSELTGRGCRDDLGGSRHAKVQFDFMINLESGK